MSELDLQPFCSRDQARFYICTPFTRDEWTYATDGAICIRVPRREGMTGDEKAPRADTLFPAQFPLLRPFPDLDLPPAEEEDCSVCDGRGYEHDCPYCECLCDTCSGNQRVSTDDSISIGLRGATFACKYMRLLACLPNTLIPQQLEPNKAMPFRFDGGEGLLMPVRGTKATHLVREATPLPQDDSNG